jgi:hypothetical protein
VYDLDIAELIGPPDKSFNERSRRRGDAVYE